MINIILGDDVGESRKEFVRLKEEYENKGYEIFNLNEANISELDKSLYQSEGLFFNKKVFFGENLLSQKENRLFLKKYDNDKNEIDFILWEEELEGKIAKFIFKYAKIHSFKLPYNIFKFLDSVYPLNLKEVINYMNQISNNVEENIILYMLERRIRDLILIQNNLKPEKKLAEWQIARLKSQAKKWEVNQLVSFYDSLYRIEALTKTSKTYYSIKKSLDILFCYYL
jgi:CHAT domain-containing protein